MERKKTALEQFLIKHGWKLTEKTYRGNKSQFTGVYVFSKNIWITTIKVELNQKRDSVVGVRLHVHETSFVLDLSTANDLHNILLATKELLECFEQDKERPSNFVIQTLFLENIYTLE